MVIGRQGFGGNASASRAWKGDKRVNKPGYGGLVFFLRKGGKYKDALRYF
jgi:hypothetical protein